MAKQKFRITNWFIYNKALINRDSLAFRLTLRAAQGFIDTIFP